MYFNEFFLKVMSNTKIDKSNVYAPPLKNVWRDFRLPMSALARVARKSFNGKFTAKKHRQSHMHSIATIRPNNNNNNNNNNNKFTPFRVNINRP